MENNKIFSIVIWGVLSATSILALIFMIRAMSVDFMGILAITSVSALVALYSFLFVNSWYKYFNNK